MIISIEISVNQLADQPIEKSEDFFSEILRSSRRGHHIVIIPRAIARWAAENLQLSGADRAHLERLKGEFTQLGGLREAPTTRMLKVNSFAQDLQTADERSWLIGVNEMLAGRFLEKPVLLLENATNDGDLYNELLSHEARRRGITNLAYQIGNGGGGTTFQEVERFADLKHIVVCVCDHDKLTPYSSRSETFRKAKATSDAIQHIGTVIPTPGREVENFLPLDLVFDLYPEYCLPHLQTLRGLIHAQGNPASGDCLWLYFDVKEGVCSGKFVQKCTSDEARNWVQQKYQIDDLNDNDMKINGFGQNVVERLFANGANLSALHKFTRSEYWLRHFATWFDALLPFFQSRSSTRI